MRTQYTRSGPPDHSPETITRDLGVPILGTPRFHKDQTTIVVRLPPTVGFVKSPKHRRPIHELTYTVVVVDKQPQGRTITPTPRSSQSRRHRHVRECGYHHPTTPRVNTYGLPLSSVSGEHTYGRFDIVPPVPIHSRRFRHTPETPPPPTPTHPCVVVYN